MLSSVLSLLAQEAPTIEEVKQQLDLDSLDHDGDVLLLDRRDHVADPRRLHGVRSGRRTSQERHVDGDEEHPHDRRRHADVLLLRLVHLRLLRGGLAEERPRQPGCGSGLLRADGALELRDGPEHGEQPHGPPEPCLLPRVPPLLLDDRVDHVRRDHRARPALRVPDPRGRARLGRLDHGRRLGLERRRLADDAVRLPRRDRVARRARRGGRVHA